MYAQTRPNPEDPRVIRTRELIQQAFAEFISKKDFNDMTVSDITRHAKINRVTFYAHYADKYELLNTMINNQLIQLLFKGIDPQNGLTPESLTRLICALCEYHQYTTTRCPRNVVSLRSVMEKNTKDQLQKYMLNQLTTQLPMQDARNLEVTATMISWSLYGSTLEWMNKPELERESPDQLAAYMVPLLTSWIDTLQDFSM